MRLDVFCLLVIGCFINAPYAVGKAKDVQNKVQVAEPIQKHSHQHTIYKESPSEYHNHELDEANDGKSGRIIIHNPKYNSDDEYAEKQKYNPEKKNKPKNKKAAKKKSKKQKKKKYGDDQDFKKILENYDDKADKSDEGSNDGGYKTSVRTEHYEVKKINPNARYPDEKYIIEGAYKVQETDPWGFPTTSFHKYDSPISKIAASILSKYDYTNFRPGESDEYQKEKEERRDHDNIEYGGNDDDSNVDSYEDFDKKKKSQGYTNPSSDEYSDGHSFEITYGHQKKNQDYTNPAPKVTHPQDYIYGVSQGHNNGKDYEKSAGYEQFVEKKPRYTAPVIQVSIQPSHENLQSNQGNANKNQQPEGYNILIVPKVDTRHVGHATKQPVKVEYVVPQAHVTKQYGNVEYVTPRDHVVKKPVTVEYITPHRHGHDHDSVEREMEYEFEKEFGHLSEPGHSAGLTDSHHDYDGEWQKHIIDYLYGQPHNSRRI